MTPLLQMHHEFAVEVNGPAMVDVTATVAAWLKQVAARDGLLTVFLRHTSASLTIQDSASSNVHADLLEALARLAPESSAYRQNCEGGDDMPAHIKAVLTSVSLSIPVLGGAQALGPRQGIFLIEHRKRSTPRSIVLHFVGSCD
jgi:secondary thiamine-phosphate synthase enzyme